MKKKEIVIAALFWFLGWAGLVIKDISADVVMTQKTDNLWFPITTAGDTAAVMKFTPAYALDSFVYACSLETDNATDTCLVKWVSPYQIMKLTPSATWDVDRVISCSVVFNATTFGFVIDPAATYTTAAKICDTLTYVFNNTTTLKDSIAAQDSGSYVKLVDKFSTVTHAKRWTMKIALTGGAGSTLDTAGVVTTKAMIADSMVKAANASACSTHITAYDSTTFWIVRSDDPGLDFAVFMADTTTDTTRTQANVASRSVYTDTIPLTPTITTNDGPNYNAFYGHFRLDSSVVTTQGIGASDSVYMKLQAGLYRFGSWLFHTIASDSCAGCPCSLKYSKPYAAANDTLFKDQLFLYIRISDTASDTNVTLPYPLHQSYRLYNQGTAK